MFHCLRAVNMTWCLIVAHERHTMQRRTLVQFTIVPGMTGLAPTIDAWGDPARDNVDVVAYIFALNPTLLKQFRKDCLQ